MEIYSFDFNNKKQNNIFIEESTLLIGEFDVFHIGHNELLNKAKSLSSKNKIGITVFETKKKKEILPLKNRLQNLANIGIDFVILIKFDYSFKSLGASEFIDHITIKYNIENIIVGSDFRFGKDRMWGANELHSYFKNTFICEIKKINNIKISSSGIAEMIFTGEIELINSLLIIPYNPTIKYEDKNIFWYDQITKPHNGIYYVKVAIDDYWYHGILHISMKSNNEVKLLNYKEEIINGDLDIQIIIEDRIIVNSRMDNITKEDEKKCLEFFYTFSQK